MGFQYMLVWACLSQGLEGGGVPPHPPSNPPLTHQATSLASPREKNPPPEAALVAYRFLTYLLHKDWEALLDLAAFPFWLESTSHTSPKALSEAWEKQLSPKPLEDYEIRGAEVLSFQQMQERFGPPPQRLAKLPLGQKGYWFAVVNVSGKAVVLLLREFPARPPSGPVLKVVAFHD